MFDYIVKKDYLISNIINLGGRRYRKRRKKCPQMLLSRTLCSTWAFLLSLLITFSLAILVESTQFVVPSSSQLTIKNAVNHSSTSLSIDTIFNKSSSSFRFHKISNVSNSAKENNTLMVNKDSILDDLNSSNNNSSTSSSLDDSEMQNDGVRNGGARQSSLKSKLGKSNGTITTTVISSNRNYTHNNRHNKKSSSKSSNSRKRNRKKLTILGLFELTRGEERREDGYSEMLAAKIALSDINDRNIVQGYELTMYTNNTKCDSGVGMDAFYYAIHAKKNLRMISLLGTACSEVTERLAKIVQYWNMVQVSFGSTSPSLSDRKEFPLFYRTVAPICTHDEAIVEFIRYFNWDSVTFFAKNENRYTMPVNHLVRELENANISIEGTLTFSEADFRDQLQEMKQKDSRIIIASFGADIAPGIFCEAYQMGNYGSDYAWILIVQAETDWWSKEGVDKYYSAEQFRQRLKNANASQSPFAPETYDAMWSVALGLQGVRSKFNYTLDSVSYQDSNFSARFMEEIQNLNFVGISGPVSFSGSDRVGITAIMQIQGGKKYLVGLFSPANSYRLNFNCVNCVKIQWHKDQVPIAKRELRFKIIRVEGSPYIIVATVASCGIMLAAAFLGFNLYHRKLKYIKLSSPRLNNMVIIGCIFAYMAVILLGSDFGPEADGKHFAYICTVRAYLLSTRFSLAFGAMFAKTYRVHRIFTRSCLGIVKNKLLRDTQLMTLVMALLVIDCLIVSSWAIFDPMQRNLQNLTSEPDPIDRSVLYQLQIEVCRSQHGHVWLSILYGYKSLLLVVGVYMAWETRHVKIQALNDSNYIGLCVYVVVLTSVLGVSLANLVSEKVTLSFVSVTTLILISTTVTLCLLFLPKIHAIVKTPSGVDPVVESMGLKIECNTRRFMVEDTKESLFRAEVQNRVYKRQIELIDAEIRRVEMCLTQNDAAKKLENGKSSTVQVTMDPCSSSEESESQSEIYTIYLHGPRYIIPISIFNKSTVAAAASEAKAVATAIGISTSTSRSSWPNSHSLLAPSADGLINGKYCFKSEPRLLTETGSEVTSNCNNYYYSSQQEEQQQQSNKQQSHSADNVILNNKKSNKIVFSPHDTIITPSSIRTDGESQQQNFEQLEISKHKHNFKNNIDFHNKNVESSSHSCQQDNISNNANGDIFLSPITTRRKDSSTSNGSSKQKSTSFLLSMLKTPLSYLTGIISYSNSSNSNGGNFGNNNNKYGINFRDDTGEEHLLGEQINNFQQRKYKEQQKYVHHHLLREPSDENKKKLSSSVPVDLWAVRNSPVLGSRKKTSIDSTHVLYPLDSFKSSSMDPVFKLTLMSDESPYL